MSHLLTTHFLQPPEIFSFYKLGDPDMVDMPLLEGTKNMWGGAADAFVRELEERIGGERSDDCVEELGAREFSDVSEKELKLPRKFVC